MLVHERDDGALALGMATPRRWLADGQKIEIQRAPTYFGRVSMTIESRAASGSISAAVTMPDRSRPRELFVRLRHPEGKAIRRVTVNGVSWTDYDARKEWVRIADPKESRYSIECSY